MERKGIVRAEAHNRIPEEKRELARAMICAGKRYDEVARALDISRGSVFNIVHESGLDVGEVAREVRARMAAKALFVADHLLNCISDDVITQATLKERAIAAGIFMDKAREFALTQVSPLRRPHPDREAELRVLEHGLNDL